MNHDVVDCRPRIIVGHNSVSQISKGFNVLFSYRVGNCHNAIVGDLVHAFGASIRNVQKKSHGACDPAVKVCGSNVVLGIVIGSTVRAQSRNMNGLIPLIVVYEHKVVNAAGSH